jgi:hypothetical protein
MKTFASTGTALLFASAVALAGAPVKKPVTGYAALWSNSPFTSKPPPPPPGEQVTPLDDWALGGVSEIEGGYMVTIFHKKNAGETKIIRPTGTMVKVKDEMEWITPGASGSYKVDRVEYGKDSWKDTVVYLSAGGRSDKVSFDEKLLAPAAAAAPAQNRLPGQQQGQQPGQQPLPNAIAPGQPGGPPAPRQRVQTPTPSRGR